MIGELLGPYRIQDELGTGGMGKVYSAIVEGRAHGIDVGTKVAIKLVHPHLLETPGFFKRFLREAEIGKSVRHPNVVRTYDADALAHSGTQHHFLVMEYVEGQTLRELLAEIGRVPEELCRHITREVSNALQVMHEAGIVHRDLKPDNVLITKDESVKVMDLGVARLADEVIRLSQTGAFVGSVLYAAPEQFGGGGKNIDGRADLCALGLSLYELATGEHPFAHDDLRTAIKRQLNEEPRRASAINPQLSAFFEEIIHTLIAKDRDERFASAKELLAVLDDAEHSAWWKTRVQHIRAETKQPIRRIRIPRETAIYGRDEEMDKLAALWEHVKKGEGQVVLVEGEAGIGKTRLVDEFAGRMRQEGEDLNFLFGAYPPGGAATAAGAFSTAYREQFGEENLQETLKDYLTVTPSLIPAFAALLLGEATPEGSETLTKESIQTVFVHATRALATERPTIILIDDLHLALEEGRALFAMLAMALQGSRVLLVGTCRPEVPAEWVSSVNRLDNATHLDLRRLGPKDLSKLLVDAFRSEKLAEELGFQIGAKSDGNPFFVFEIVQGLRDGKYITQAADGSWLKTAVIADIRIPSSVMELIDARLGELDEDDKDLLDVASCCGFEFDPGLVTDALGLGRIPALKRLGRIEKRHRLIRSAGLAFVFDHHQVREALYEGLPGMLRQEYHAALGEALEKRERATEVEPTELEGSVAVDLCDHFLSAGRGDRALRYVDAAFDHLESGYQHAAAVDLGNRVLESKRLLSGGPRMELLLKKASALASLSRGEEEQATLDEALGLAKSAAERARVHRTLGSHLSSRTEYELAYASLEKAVELTREAGERRGEGLALASLAGAAMYTGSVEEALDHARTAIEVAKEIGNREDEAQATSVLGSVFYLLGRWEEARECYDRAIAISEELKLPRTLLPAAINVGEVLRALGRFGEASERYGAALAQARQLGVRRNEGIACINLGETYAGLGDAASSRQYLETACDLMRETGVRALRAYTQHDLALLDILEGRTDEGVRELEEALAELRAVPVPPYVAELLVVLGRVFVDLERKQDARRVLEEALSLGRELKAADEIVRSAAGLAALGGDSEAALTVLSEYDAHLKHRSKTEARYLLWRATGDRAHLEEAHRLLTFFRDHAPEQYHTSLIENVPLHRDIAAAWKEAGS